MTAEEHARLSLLFERAIAKTITTEEREELFELMANPLNREVAERLLGTYYATFLAEKPPFSDDAADIMIHNILKKEESPLVKNERQPFYVQTWVKVAAAIVLFMLAGIYLFDGKHQIDDELTISQAVEKFNIKPGQERAVLTLGDGRTILLDDVESGLLTNDAGVNINKTNDGQLSYQQNGNTPTSVVYNTITIPKGGQYKLVLPDGTRVHLNSESSLRYPTRFIGDKREVELDGEAFFEVKSNEKQSFYVHTATQSSQVLGTAFNINAYTNESVVKTTLAEGKLKVSNKHNQSVVIRPGQASINRENNSSLLVRDVDLEEELAWHNGYFVFNNEPIKSIMKKVARWYDIDVDYEGNMENKVFGGVFQRSKSIVQLLNNFKETGMVDFKITERKVIVMEQ
ncbi:FecR domain-containing protein [Olivibacter sitiensis]|uniref:FecR domain-containing protein n=1 Tax=Olivibacter sitiensis TaxID=376470 RepID=UPI000424B7AF|nr:FecR domain-containing protein [Olivibacter sitiensis]